MDLWIFGASGGKRGSACHLRAGRRADARGGTANLRTKMLVFRGFDSSIILIPRGRILMSRGSP